MLTAGRLRHIVFALLVAGVFAWSPHAHAARRAAFVLDATTGHTLYASHGDARRFPASLTKMMTLYLLFEEIEDGHVSLGTRFRVSAHGAAQAPVKLWLKPGDTITAGDAIRAIVTLSANDVAATIGENHAGNEVAFARRMTRTAHRLGMTHTQFRNASGLPARGQYTTAHDMALLGAALQARFPKYYSYFRTTKFAFRGHHYHGHNHLLRRFRYVDGIKTGYTRASGFNIVTSFRRGGRKMIVVVMGGPSWRQRDARAAALIRRFSGKLRAGKTYYASLMAAVGRTKAPTPRRKPKEVMVASATATGAVSAFSVRLADDVSIRVGALPTLAAAQAMLKKTEPVVDAALDGAEPRTRRVDIGGTTFFRASYTGFTDVDRARHACAVLKQHHFDCYAAVRPRS